MERIQSVTIPETLWSHQPLALMIARADLLGLIYAHRYGLYTVHNGLCCSRNEYVPRIMLQQIQAPTICCSSPEGRYQKYEGKHHRYARNVPQAAE